MEYKLKNFSGKDLSFLKKGDTLDNCNCSQAVVTEVSVDLTLVNDKSMLNMTNVLLTGTIIADKTFMNAQINYCYWLHLDKGLENYPTYKGEGATCGPDVTMCRHTDPTKVINISCDDGDMQDFKNAREDINL